jgi:hypothetical protein
MMPEQTSSGGKHMDGFCFHNSMKRISFLQAFRLGFGSISGQCDQIHSFLSNMIKAATCNCVGGQALD